MSLVTPRPPPRPPPRPVPNGSSANGVTDGQPPAMKRARTEAGLGEPMEVRFACSSEAELALEFNGTLLQNVPITVQLDTTSKDGTKVLVQGLPASVSNEELSDHLSGAGVPVFIGPSRRSSTSTRAVAEVRFETPEEAQMAVESLDGSELEGATVSVMIDESSKDGVKVLLTGLPGSVNWQMVKDHCSQAGQVAYANVRQPASRDSSTGTSPHGTKRRTDGSEGQVRFQSPSDTAAALKRLNGSWLGDRQIRLSLDPGSTDQTKLLVSGLSPFTKWQELKDHFACIGAVAYAQVKADGGVGPPAAFARVGPPAAFARGVVSATWRISDMYGPCGGGSKGAHGKGMGHPYAHETWAPGKGKYNKGSGRRSRPVVADGNGTFSGEVRYDNPSHAQDAAERLSGSLLMGAAIAVELDVSSKDGSKVFVHGLPNGCQWQELKDHFGQLGPVAFAAVIGPCEVRMETQQEARQAVAMLDGTEVGGSVISVEADRTSKDGTRLMVSGLPLDCVWQEVKDLFAQAGTVAFVSR